MIEKHNLELKTVIEEVEKKKNECRALVRAMDEGSLEEFIRRNT